MPSNVTHHDTPSGPNEMCDSMPGLNCIVSVTGSTAIVPIEWSTEKDVPHSLHMKVSAGASSYTMVVLAEEHMGQHVGSCGPMRYSMLPMSPAVT